ncbi:molybdenum cofactor biosynthesis protein MoaE [Knoellia flava]|uniref:Molybdopterin biosynthesis protein MoeE n=1 Tax=Knoellia flava TaxID=913969 RepID=A0A8H9FR49_9MICO|nr:molybdenum cofactor biosynthesis protein MoaE [Knoellia flava]GGB72330.1 molybdopterin biosynthesis protein MoeE [Knoellia flava]
MQHEVRSDSTAVGVVALAEIRESALSLDEVVESVRHPSCGGITVFLGVVRDHDRGQEVSALDYSVHPSAEERLREVTETVAARSGAVRLAALHRSGHLDIGDVAVVVAASAAHRDAAFGACRDLIDTLKAEVPIWKHQHLGDGGTEWVGLP